MTGNNPHGTASNHHVLSVLVQNRPGVLARVASLFARRGYRDIILLLTAKFSDSQSWHF